MVKQWKRSLSQSDILSDGQAFKGGYIDQPISEVGSPALTGYQDNFISTVSDPFKTSISGSAQADPYDSGLLFGNSGAAGDTAELIAGSPRRYDELSEFRRTFFIKSDDALPTSDDFEIGFVESVVNSSGSVYLDLSDGKFVAGTSSKSVSLPAADKGVVVEVIINIANGESVLNLSGAVNSTTTISEIDLGQMGTFARYNSNGNSERIRIYLAREELVG